MTDSAGHLSPASTADLVAAGRATITPNYAPAPIVLDRGQGAWIYDRDGKEYLDFLAGIAVSVLGHSHPALVAALQDQAGKLLHVSNAFFNEPQVLLQERLTELTFGDRVYFANSGAEANEAAMKLARRYQRVVRGTPRFEFITFEKSFHGRTYGAITATGQPKYHAGFEPMVPGFCYARFGDLASVQALVSAHTAAIMIEPVQGEGGVVPADPEFLRGLRALCDREGIVLIFDEVQCGAGRTGKWFAHEHFGVTPDIMTSAKGLGGGVPLGAMIATEAVSAGFERGSHASTYGGNPLATRAGYTVLETIAAEGLLERATESGARLRAGAEALSGRFAAICDVRGLGGMNGVELDADAATAGKVVAAGRDAGLLFNTAGGNVLRLVPPLVVGPAEVDEALNRLETALTSVFA